MFVIMIFPKSLEMAYVRSKTRSLGQIGEPILVIKELWFTSLLFNAKSHNPEGSGERLQGHSKPYIDGTQNKYLEASRNGFYKPLQTD